MMILMAYVLMLFLLRQMAHKTPKSNPLEQIWVVERRYETQWGKYNDIPMCIYNYSASFDTCLCYLPFWEPIRKGDTIQTITLDFVPLYRIQ